QTCALPILVWKALAVATSSAGRGVSSPGAMISPSRYSATGVSSLLSMVSLLRWARAACASRPGLPIASARRDQVGRAPPPALCPWVQVQPVGRRACSRWPAAGARPGRARPCRPGRRWRAWPPACRRWSRAWRGGLHLVDSGQEPLAVARYDLAPVRRHRRDVFLGELGDAEGGLRLPCLGAVLLLVGVVMPFAAVRGAEFLDLVEHGVDHREQRVLIGGAVVAQVREYAAAVSDDLQRNSDALQLGELAFDINRVGGVGVGGEAVIDGIQHGELLTMNSPTMGMPAGKVGDNPVACGLARRRRTCRGRRMTVIHLHEAVQPTTARIV